MEDDELQGGFEVVDAQPPLVVSEVDHAHDERTEAQGAGLLQGDGLAVANEDLASSGLRVEATGEQKQLAKRGDQQQNLVVNLPSRAPNKKLIIEMRNEISNEFHLDLFKELKTFAPLDDLVDAVVSDAA